MRPWRIHLWEPAAPQESQCSGAVPRGCAPAGASCTQPGLASPCVTHMTPRAMAALGDAVAACVSREVAGGLVADDLIFQMSPVTQPRRPNQTAIHLARANFKAIAI